jgi:transposase
MPGRPAALSPREFDDIVETINHAFHARWPLSLPEIASAISTKFGKALSHDTVDHLLTRDPRIKTYRGKPIDE